LEDVAFIAATVGFFALAAAYVRFCDRVIGPDPVDHLDEVGEREPERLGR
jgi:hypothetical protein